MRNMAPKAEDGTKTEYPLLNLVDMGRSSPRRSPLTPIVTWHALEPTKAPRPLTGTFPQQNISRPLERLKLILTFPLLTNWLVSWPVLVLSPWERLVEQAKTLTLFFLSREGTGQQAERFIFPNRIAATLRAPQKVESLDTAR